MCRVDKCQPVRVEQMVSDPALVDDRISYRGVESVSDDGMTRERAVNPELMCSARQWFQLDERMRVKASTHSIACHGRSAGVHCSPAWPRVEIATNGRLDLPRVSDHDAAEKREITLPDTPLEKCFCQDPMRTARLGDNDNAGCVAIESMHDSRAYQSTGGLKKVMRERVRQRAGFGSPRGMCQQAGFLVYYNQIVIFVQNPDRNRLRRRGCWSVVDGLDEDAISLVQAPSFQAPISVDKHVAVGDKASDLDQAQLSELVTEEFVEAEPFGACLKFTHRFSLPATLLPYQVGSKSEPPRGL